MYPVHLLVEANHRLSTFSKAWSGNLIDDLRSIPDTVIAGGAVVGAITGVAAGDLDIFLMSPPAKAEGTLHLIWKAIQINQERVGGKKLLVTRSKHAVTVYRCAGTRLTAPPVQIILNVQESVSDLLLNFDVDCCHFAYCLARSQVLTTERGLRALRYS